MLKFLPSPDILLLLIISISMLSACEREQSASAPPAALETPAVEQVPADNAQPAAAAESSTESTAGPEATTTSPTTEQAKPEATIAAETATAEPPAQTPAATLATAKEQSATHAESLALARKSGCLACHAIDKKVVGPAWQDVARRYANNADARAQLIEKVSKGGKGNWTEVVGTAAMPPYYPRVSKENIEKLVDFVLSLAEK